MPNGEICDAKIRPFPNDVELACETMGARHVQHVALLRDYAYDGSRTTVTWDEDDRRTFHGKWPGRCPGPNAQTTCTLPIGHHGRCAP